MIDPPCAIGAPSRRGGFTCDVWRRLGVAFLLSALIGTGCAGQREGSSAKSTTASEVAPPAAPTTNAPRVTDARTSAETGVIPTDVTTTSGAGPADKIPYLSDVVTVEVAMRKVAIEKIDIDTWLRNVPRSPLIFQQDGDSVLVDSQLPTTCAWMRVQPDGEVLLGETPLPCDRAVRPAVLTRDGAGLDWAASALQQLDDVARGIATSVRNDLITVMVAKKGSADVSTVQDRFPGLRIVPVSTRPSEVSLSLDGSTLALAVRGQSGRCYLMVAEIASPTVTRYGTGDVGDECTASAATTTATDTAWPSAP